MFVYSYAWLTLSNSVTTVAAFCTNKAMIPSQVDTVTWQDYAPLWKGTSQQDRKRMTTQHGG